MPVIFFTSYTQGLQPGVVRGLHYQLARPQGKLVHVARGRIFDVAVDIRRGSPSFGLWTGVELSDIRPYWNTTSAAGDACVDRSVQQFRK